MIEQSLESDAQSTFGLSPKGTTYKSCFFITMPVFIGYACCFSLQHRLGIVFGLTDGVSNNKRSIAFGVGTSFVYFFNLIFRVLGHNICFACFSPKNRVIIALISMIIGMTILSIVSFATSPPSLFWVFLSYAFCGVCEGSYCPNMLNVVNNMGNSRHYVVTSIPFGVSLITIISFAAIAMGFPFQYCYIFTTVCLVGSVILYLCTVYPVAKNVSDDFDLKAFFYDFKDICSWFPKIAVHCIVFIVNMFCLSLFNPGVTLYEYNERVTYRMFNKAIAHDWFILTCNVGNFLGDYFGRAVMDRKRIIHPILFFVLLLFGLGINLSLIPEITPFASFLFGWANGGLYMQSTKLISQLFEHQYHLTATSTWLFLGDVGSTTGSNVLQPLRSVISKLKLLYH